MDWLVTQRLVRVEHQGIVCHGESLGGDSTSGPSQSRVPRNPACPAVLWAQHHRSAGCSALTPAPRLHPVSSFSHGQTEYPLEATGQTSACQTWRDPGTLEPSKIQPPALRPERRPLKGRMVSPFPGDDPSPWESQNWTWLHIWGGKQEVGRASPLPFSAHRDYNHHREHRGDPGTQESQEGEEEEGAGEGGRQVLGNTH